MLYEVITNKRFENIDKRWKHIKRETSLKIRIPYEDTERLSVW